MLSIIFFRSTKLSPCLERLMELRILPLHSLCEGEVWNESALQNSVAQSCKNLSQEGQGKPCPFSVPRRPRNASWHPARVPKCVASVCEFWHRCHDDASARKALSLASACKNLKCARTCETKKSLRAPISFHIQPCSLTITFRHLRSSEERITADTKNGKEQMQNVHIGSPRSSPEALHATPPFREETDSWDRVTLGKQNSAARTTGMEAADCEHDDSVSSPLWACA